MLFKTTAALAVTSSCLLCGQGAIAGAGIDPLTTVRVASGLNRPIFVTHAPGDSTRLFIVEQRGLIKILDLAGGTVLATPFLDIDALVVNFAGNDERGLLGLAFHPNYQVNGLFYVNYINNSSDTTIRRYKISGDPNIADASSGFTLMTLGQPFSNHNGGWIGFGPNDGYLYIATGDGGNFCDMGPGHSSGGNAQDITNNLLGKMLRIVPSTTPAVGGYLVPADNPFVGITGDDEIWAYGLRNPWRASFDRDNGDLYIGDVGQDAREEIDFQRGVSPGGENYGWKCMEGNGCSTASGCGAPFGCTCFSASLTDPIHDYTHIPPPPPTGFVCAVTGGYVYRGCSIAGLSGTYFFADFCGGAIWSFRVVGGLVTEFVNRTPELSPSSGNFTVNQVVSFAEDERGEMYIVDQGSGSDGQIFKIVGVCLTDVNGDGVTNVLDLIALLLDFGQTVCATTDINEDGVVNVLDLIELLLDFGTSCP
ncbi:MAG: PQQ-dependent sugar dehydrogenase [Planctomycetes bacterium]|nr:PQQ-dependent sugar dehydrogenase [Planctomycetota bacterium]